MSKSKKKAKKMDLSTFQQQGGGAPTRSMLPSAPGELPSGPGQGRGGYGRSRRGGYGDRGDRPSSRADESNQWRRGNNSRRDPPRSRDGGGFNSRRRDDGDRPPRRENQESRYGSDFSRDQFGSKKQGPARIGASRDSFGSSRIRNPRVDNDDRVMDRKSFGTVKQGSAIRTPTNNRYRRDDSYGTRRESAGGFGSRNSKPSMFDGSGHGFAHHLVAELLNNDGGSSESTGSSKEGSERRVNYYPDANKPVGAARFRPMADPPSRPAQRNLNAPWGQPARAPKQKSPEEIAEEEAEKAAKEEAARLEKHQRDEKKRLAKKKKEDQRKLLAEEKAAREAEEKRMAGLLEDFESMFGSGEASALTIEHINDALPQLEINRKKAKIIGTALGMTVNGGVITLNEAISIFPEDEHDTIFIGMLVSLYARMGEMKFLEEINASEVDVFQVAMDKDAFEQRLITANLKCLVSDNETESKLEDAFSKHVNLADLNAVVRSFQEFPTDLLFKVCNYIFEEYFKERNPEDPASFFDNQDIFTFLEDNLDGHVHIIEAAIVMWYDNGARPEYLVPMFDRLLRQGYIVAEEMTRWCHDFEGNATAKMEAQFVEIAEDQTFNDWLMEVEQEYVIEEEEEEEEEDEEM